MSLLVPGAQVLSYEGAVAFGEVAMVDLFGRVCQKKMLMSEFSWNNSLVSLGLGQCGFAFAFALAL